MAQEEVLSGVRSFQFRQICVKDKRNLQWRLITMGVIVVIEGELERATFADDCLSMILKRHLHMPSRRGPDVVPFHKKDALPPYGGRMQRTDALAFAVGEMRLPHRIGKIVLRTS